MNRPNNNNKMPSRQLGAGMVGWLIIIGLVGAIVFQIFKLVPHYIESVTVDGELKSLAEVIDGVESLSNRELKQKLAAFYRVNGISKAVQDGTTISRKDGHVLIDMQYEQRIEMFYNIDIVLSFHKQLDSQFPGKCCLPRDKK